MRARGTLDSTMTASNHWDRVYETKGDRTSWFRPTLQKSLEIIDGLGLPAGSRAIDVGSGTSTLLDSLIERGFSKVTANDLSGVALEKVAARLGDNAKLAEFIVGDITKVELVPNAYDLWHDRAVFHFLLDPEARRAYIRQVLSALRPDGRIIVATFGPQGPEQCSGLDVARYDQDSLHSAFGLDMFEKLGHAGELHETPWGTEQEFVYCYCRCKSC